MSPVQTVAQVFDAIQQAKTGAADFTTNFFSVEKRLQDWIARGELAYEQTHGAAFFFRKDRDFQHLYYCASDVGALQSGLSVLLSVKSEKVVLDIVGKEAGLADFLTKWEQSGFRPYTKLFRLARIAAPVAAGTEEGVEFAQTGDTTQILSLLEEQFDPYGEQIPLLYELEAAIAQQQILVARRDEVVAGLLFFETQGVSSTLRFWTVDAKFRALKLGSALMRRYFTTQNAVKRYVLWVAADNANAIQKYEHYGYKPDGLVDYVLVNQLIRS
ncbi:MAG: GNAT family N-acetyltransferase, partial [Verrucomicrobiota bacterium]